MKKNILTLVLFAVTVFNLTAQTTTIFNNALNNVSISFSPNGEKLIGAKDLYTNPSGINNLGFTKIFNVNPDYTMTLIDDYQLNKANVSGVSAVVISPVSTSISNDGTHFVYFRNDVDDNNDFQFTLVKNEIEIASYTNKELWSIKSNNTNYYMLLAFGGGTYTTFYKIDASTNNVEWQISQSGNRGKEILVNEGNPHLKMLDGNIVEYDNSNGNILSTTSGSPEDFYQINQFEEIEKIDTSEKKLYTDLGTTEWEYRFFTDYPASKWRTIGTYTYATNQSGQLYVFDENMEDVYKTRIAYFDWENNEEYIASYIYPDASITYITRIGNVVYAKHYDFPDVSVPVINESADNVVSTHDEQILTGSGFVNSNSFISTVVMNDDDLPMTGDIVDANLIVAPTGFTLLGGDFAPILNDDGYAEFLFYKASGGDLYIRVKLYFKGTSALGVDENNITSLNIVVSPNPSKKTIKLSNINNINEIIVFNNLGQIVFKTELYHNSNDYLIDILDFNSGLYFIQLKNDKGIYIKKFIKE